MKNILVTGSNGQLGNEIRVLSSNYPDLNFWFTDVAELDICDLDAIRDYVADKPLYAIINCAAYTAVDKAESDRELCEAINAQAPANLGVVATEKGAKMIQVSTDYVYSGTACKPYTESDPVAPVSVYGITKLEGEKRLLAVCENSVILRTSWLYSSFGNNFVKTMIRLGNERPQLGVIFDQVGTPTYARDLADVILKLIMAPEFVIGIYNYSNEGVCSWYDFARKIHEFAGIATCEVKPIETADYPTPAQRPHYSVMNKKKLKNRFGIAIPHWEESLRECMVQLASIH
ncbi:MAG: dTDP-4-dehydrorhamnose reductase [Bacteroidales bacterium]